ncbi:MAG: hypothetical protein GX968_01390 [Tissierellia bacterium]|nr:hypothetical protein [Tissierellia bacterium]
MTSKQIKKLISRIIIIVTIIIATERLYNSRSEFQVTAEDASHYGVVEAKLETRLKLKDFDYLYDVLEENYPFFEVNKRQNGVDWLENKRKYKRLIRNTKNDAEFYVAMEKILGDLHNSHVDILSGDEFKRIYKSLYIDFSQNEDAKHLAWYDAFSNPFVMYRYEFDGDLSDVQLYREPVLETKTLVEDELAYMKITEMAGKDLAEKDFNRIKNFLENVSEYEKLIIDIRGNSGGWDGYWQSIVNLVTKEPLEVKYYSFFKNGHKSSMNPYRVQNVTTIKDLDEKILDKFPEEVKSNFDFYKTYNIYINPWAPDHNPSDYLGFKGKVYLLVDSDVFAASENFASFAKDSGFATLVGETTGGNRIFEEVPIMFLPKSKFAIKYSRELGINKDGTINMETRTIPHIEVDPTPNEDFTRDKCIQTVIQDNGN